VECFGEISQCRKFLKTLTKMSSTKTEVKPKTEVKSKGDVKSFSYNYIPWILFIIAVIVILVLIGLIIYLIYRLKNSNSNGGGSNTSGSYIGCYNDNFPRDFGYFLSTTGISSTDGYIAGGSFPAQFVDWNDCQKAAKSGGYKYFGLQAATGVTGSSVGSNSGNTNLVGQCFVDNTYGSYGTVQGSCTTPGCTTCLLQDSAGHYFGGAWTNAVYAT
jgi:hypothetical protein